MPRLRRLLQRILQRPGRNLRGVEGSARVCAGGIRMAGGCPLLKHSWVTYITDYNCLPRRCLRSRGRQRAATKPNGAVHLTPARNPAHRGGRAFQTARPLNSLPSEDIPYHLLLVGHGHSPRAGAMPSHPRSAHFRPRPEHLPAPRPPPAFWTWAARHASEPAHSRSR